MYETFFGFRERPFDLTPNPRYLVLTDVHREALSNLEYGITSRKGITLLIGEAGSGKTTLLRTAIEKQPARVHCINVNNPVLTRREFVEMLAERFGLTEGARTSKAVLLAELETLLKKRRDAGETTVLIVDEAQSLSVELFEEVRLLANIETNEEKLLLVIIAGQPELVDRLNDRGLRQLKQRVALRCELRPLTLQETAAYLAGRIKAAGGVGAQVFTREAVTTIFENARGIPRVISVIADNALLSGFAQGRRPVTSQMVLEVCQDFDFGSASGGHEAVAASVADEMKRSVSAPPPTRMLDIAPERAEKASDAAIELRPSPTSGTASVAPGWRRFFFERGSGQR